MNAEIYVESYPKSLPARGARIEITHWLGDEITPSSLPARGARIEINSSPVIVSVTGSLPARGARIEIRGELGTYVVACVAPRTGSED